MDLFYGALVVLRFIFRRFNGITMAQQGRQFYQVTVCNGHIHRGGITYTLSGLIFIPSFTRCTFMAVRFFNRFAKMEEWSGEYGPKLLNEQRIAAEYFMGFLRDTL